MTDELIVNATTRARVADIEGYLDFLEEVPGARVRVQVLDTDWDRAVTGINRHGGFPHGVPLAKWPRHALAEELGDELDQRPEDDRMAHVVSLDVSELDVSGVPPEAKTLSLFTPSLQMPGDPFMVGFFLSQPDANAEASYQEMRESRFTKAHGIRVLPAVEVPLVVFVISHLDHEGYAEAFEDEGQTLERLSDDDARQRFLLTDSRLAAYNAIVGKRRRFTEDEWTAIDEVRTLLASVPYMGGRHIRIQQDWPTSSGELEEEEGFMMQFGEELAGINCGDQGVAFVSGDRDGLHAEWESH